MLNDWNACGSAPSKNLCAYAPRQRKTDKGMPVSRGRLRTFWIAAFALFVSLRTVPLRGQTAPDPQEPISTDRPASQIPASPFPKVTSRWKTACLSTHKASALWTCQKPLYDLGCLTRQNSALPSRIIPRSSRGNRRKLRLWRRRAGSQTAVRADPQKLRSLRHRLLDLSHRSQSHFQPWL